MDNWRERGQDCIVYERHSPNALRTPDIMYCAVGFSRGAYSTSDLCSFTLTLTSSHVAARALAGMLEKIGLLPRGNIDELQLAFKLYARQDAESVRLASNYKAQWCRQVSVEFVGVWDTVSSVGAIVSRHFPYVSPTM